MQALSEILTPARTVCGLPGVSKKRLFETIARIISDDQPALGYDLSLIHISEPTRRRDSSRMPSSA